MCLLRCAVLILGVLLGTVSLAQVTLSGVAYEESTELAGQRLQLNGAGIRYRGPFKVYTAGLYLSRKSRTAEEAFEAPGGKRIAVTMLRDIDTTDLGKLFTRGVEDNLDKASFSKLIPGLLRMSQIFSDHKKLSSGDSFTMDWVPGQGTVIRVKGVAQGEPFKEPEFYTALMRIWLGRSPADARLKELLLGVSD